MHSHSPRLINTNTKKEKKEKEEVWIWIRLILRHRHSLPPPHTATADLDSREALKQRPALLLPRFSARNPSTRAAVVRVSAVEAEPEVVRTIAVRPKVDLALEVEVTLRRQAPRWQEKRAVLGRVEARQSPRKSLTRRSHYLPLSPVFLPIAFKPPCTMIQHTCN